jgi:multiple antibiotic resistance protein
MNDTAMFFLREMMKFFFLLTPFFVLSMFLSLTRKMSHSKRNRTALQTTGAVILICFILYFFGEFIFSLFGITLDAFRIGAGCILFLSAVNLVSSKDSNVKPQQNGDISVVPLAIPITIGPGTTGAILVMGAEPRSGTLQIAGLGALLVAILAVGVLLYLASYIEKLLGQKGLNILSKLTGLILAALSAQIIFTGIKNFLNL